MKWLEIIELRSAKSNLELLESQLQKLLNDLEKEAKKHTITAYSRVMIDNDLSIHLIHDSKNVEKNGSSLGTHLASLLKEYGMVNHSVWVELKST
ncbi:MAG: hypothetical protein ACMUJM_16700 [bacterium]